MKYIYPTALLPQNINLASQINQAAESLFNKLCKVDTKKIGMSEYNQLKISEYLDNPVANFQLYSYLLLLSLAENQVPLNKFVFIDHGGGSGLLSLLAKQLGLGRVIYNDIYDVSCKDTELLAKELEIQIDAFVCGDIDELIDYIKKHSISVNCISSRDVIEHIYDIDGFLRKLPFLSRNTFNVVFSSGANIRNPRIALQLRKTHLQSEYRERKAEWGHKERDALQSFFEIRKEIIKNYDESLNSKTVAKIAKKTRGLIKHDIEMCIDEYATKGEIRYKPDHATDTCDPYTGNWAEHLLDLNWLQNLLREEGFKAKIIGGYYSWSSNIYVRLVKNMLNKGLKYFGELALFYAPYYIISAKYKSEQ